MKVQKTTQPATFQPIVLEITIDSQEELNAISNLVSGYYSVPMALLDDDQILEEHQEPLVEFLKSICYALTEK